MSDAKHLEDVRYVDYSQVRFDVFKSSETNTAQLYRMSIPQSLDSKSTVHTRLRVFNPQDGKAIHFQLWSDTTYLGEDCNKTLDVGTLNHKTIRAAIDSDFAKSYRHYGANLNLIDKLNIGVSKDTYYPSLIVVAEMMST
jgi:hypothetical protein